MKTNQNSGKYIFIVIAIFIAMLNVEAINAQNEKASEGTTCTTIAHGNWTGNIWSCVGNGSSGANKHNEWIIAHDVIVNQDLTINNGDIVKILSSGSLTIGDDFTLDNAGIVILEGTMIIEDDAIVKNGGTINVSGDMVIGGDLSLINNSQVIGTGTVEIEGDVINNSGGGYIDPALYAIRWKGSISTDWHIAGNWNNGVPTGVNRIRIPSTPSGGRWPIISAGNAFCAGLIIETNAWLQVTNNRTLNIYGQLDIYPKAYLKINNNSSVSALGNTIIHSTATGTGALVDLNSNGNFGYNYAKVYRYLTGGKYHYVSSPITAASVDIYGGNSFYSYQTTNGWVGASGDVTMEPARGYAAYIINTRTAYFQGGFNTGNVSIPVYTGDWVDQDNVTWTNWNLVGNPYPSPISIQRFITNNLSAITADVYLWDDPGDAIYDTYDYAHVNFAGAVSNGNGTATNLSVIGLGQAFFVKSIAAGQVTFTNAMRDTTDETFFKNPVEIQRFKLAVTNPQNAYNEILIAFTESATDDFDNGWDGIKKSGNPNISFYSILNNEKLSIQSFAPIIGNRSVPVGIKALITGNYSLFISALENNEGMETILEDTQENVFTDMRKTDKYNFSIAVGGVYNNRFILHFNAASKWLGTTSNNWHIDANWNTAIPQANSNVFIKPNSLVEISDSAVCKNLEIAETGNLILKTNGNLQIEADLILHSQPAKHAVLIQSDTINITGSTKGNYYFEAGTNLFSVPYKNIYAQQFINQVSNYNETSGQWQILNSNDELEVGKSYLIDYEAETNINFNSSLFFNNLDVNTSNTKTAGEGWNFVGYPYQTYIDIEKFLAQNSSSLSDEGISGAIYLLASAKTPLYTYSDYSCINAIGVVSTRQNENFFDNKIAPFQGFLVKSNENGSINFNQEMKCTNSHSPVFEEAAAATKLKLGVFNEDFLYNEILIAFSELAGNAHDNLYDAEKPDFGNQQLQLYTNNNSKKYAIETYASNDFPKTISIGFKTDVETSLTFELQYLQNFPGELTLVLEDKLLNKLINLKETAQYSYETNAGEFNERFVLHVGGFCCWIGGFSENWEDFQNWSNGVPQADSYVQIPENQRVKINTTANCQSIWLGENSYLIVSETANLEVAQNIILNASPIGNANFIEYGNATVEGAIITQNYLSNPEYFITPPLSNTEISQMGTNEIYEYLESDDSWQLLLNNEQMETARGYKIIKKSADTLIQYHGQLAPKHSLQVTSNFNGWNLIGNHFPCEINWNLFDADNLLIDKAIYCWNPEEMKYEYFVNGVGNASPVIGTGKSFFIKATGEETLNFSNNLKVEDSNFVTNQVENLIILNISEGNSIDKSYLRFVNGTDLDFDSQFDAYKLAREKVINDEIYTKNNDINFSINSLQHPTTDIAIPIGISAGRFAANVHHTISAEFVNFASNLQVFLEDTELGNLTDLRTDAYQFTISESTETRFVLHLNPSPTLIETPRENIVFIYSFDNNIFVSGENLTDNFYRVEIYNIMGQKIQSSSIENQNLNTYTLNNCQGTYIVKLIGNQAVVSKKVFIK